MAAVQGHISYRLMDSEKEIVSIPIYFNTASGLLADAQAFAVALDPVLDAVLESQIVASDIVFPRSVFGTIKGSPVAGGRNEHGIVASYGATGTTKHYGLDLPSFIQAGILDKKVDPSNTDWINFAAQVLATTSTTVVQNDHQQNLAALYRTLENFRKYRRALVRAH